MGWSPGQNGNGNGNGSRNGKMGVPGTPIPKMYVLEINPCFRFFNNKSFLILSFIFSSIFLILVLFKSMLYLNNTSIHCYSPPSLCRPANMKPLDPNELLGKQGHTEETVLAHINTY